MKDNSEMRQKPRTERPNPQNNGAWFETPPWEYKDQTIEEMHQDESRVPKLLNRLRELGIVQVVKHKGLVFFYPVFNTRPLLMYDNKYSELRYERLMPYHVYDTVNYLMWKRLLKPELALSFMGLFDSVPMPEAKWGFIYGCLGDVAAEHVLKWLSK